MTRSEEFGCAQHVRLVTALFEARNTLYDLDQYSEWAFPFDDKAYKRTLVAVNQALDAALGYELVAAQRAGKGCL